MGKTSTTGGGNTRVTESTSDFWGNKTGTEDRTYEGGKLVDITHHDNKGDSHSHEVAHGVFGPYAGSTKK